MIHGYVLAFGAWLPVELLVEIPCMFIIAGAAIFSIVPLEERRNVALKPEGIWGEFLSAWLKLSVLDIGSGRR
jgi:hypothetical protein